MGWDLHASASTAPPPPHAQAPSSEQLLAALRDQNKNPTIDELNDMLR